MRRLWKTLNKLLCVFNPSLNVSVNCTLSTLPMNCQPPLNYSEICKELALDKVSETWYNNLVEVQKQMLYHVYDNSDKLRGTFESIYDMEIFMDGIRNSRNESYPNTPRMSTFDYIKSIGWRMEIVTVDKVA